MRTGAGRSMLARLWRKARGEFSSRATIATDDAPPRSSNTSEGDMDQLSHSPQAAAPQHDVPGRRIIYDVGANNGDDIPYYLMRADLVIAIEADPDLAAIIEQRFASEIQERRLIVENCVVTADVSGVDVPFYLNQGHNVLHQFGRPPDSDIHNFKEVLLPSKRLVDIVRAHGAPYYMKIDVEGYDQILLAALFSEGIRPPYISAESHSVEVFAVLVALGRYNAFKIVNGHTVHEVYHEANIRTDEEETTYSFPYHSAGPFGNDVQGCWETANTFLATLATAGLGWADIHASSADSPER